MRAEPTSTATRRSAARSRAIAGLLILCCGVGTACAPAARRDAAALPSLPGTDPGIATFVWKIRAVDNHSHASKLAGGDPDADALPIDAIAPFELPVQAMPENPDWLAADKALYKYPYADLSEAHRNELRSTMQRVATEQGDAFPTWVLDQVGTEVLFANRVAMGPGLPPPRFRWVSYVDPLLFPLSTTAEGSTSPDRKGLFPMEEKLLGRYMADLQVARLPGTLEAYLSKVVTPTLEAERKHGCVAVKFEAAYLRSLDFADVSAATANGVYARYVGGGEPTHADYKALQDFLFRYIAREAGRLGMAVHIHSLDGVGNFYSIAGADPLLLESAFNDPTLRKTNFVILHGGGVYSAHAGAMLWKPNVYVDMSLMTLLYPPTKLAEVLREWLTMFPQKVLFGSDAVAFGPDMGWDAAAWIGTKNARAALALALTNMIRSGEVSRARAEQIATMVMRTNAGGLYKLELK